MKQQDSIASALGIPGSSLIQIIYASAATTPFSREAVTNLLARARSRNSLYKITGMLLYDSGSFLQVLEGPADSIDIVLQSIMRDKRHNSTRIILRQSVPAREFQSWAMGFVDTSTSTARPAGHVNYHRAMASLPDAVVQARRYLRFFQEGLYRQQTDSALSL